MSCDETGDGFPQSVVISEMALPPLVLQKWILRMRGRGKLGEVDTIAMHSVFAHLEEGRKMSEMVLRWWGECLLLHKCTVLDLVMPRAGGIGGNLFLRMMEVFHEFMPKGSSLTLRTHHVPIPSGAPKVTKAVLLCVDPRIQALRKIISDMQNTRLMRFPGPEGVLCGATPQDCSDRELIMANLWEFLGDMGCPEAQVGAAGHEGCGKRNHVNGGSLCSKQDLAIMLDQTRQANRFLKGRGLPPIPSDLNPDGSHFVVLDKAGAFEVARSMPR